ncbi:MAG: hypothetical protein R3E89_13635 [Thiolinea sp.]
MATVIFNTFTRFIPLRRPVRHCVGGGDINQRQARQQSRIESGIREGQLVG